MTSSTLDTPLISEYPEAAAAPLVQPLTNSKPSRSFLLVFTCTLIGAAAQILMKKGASKTGAHLTLGSALVHPTVLLAFALGILTNIKLLLGYCCYGVNTFLMAAALKGRELSRLYPIIALTYVWVTILSLFLLAGEHLNAFRAFGILFIIGGVSVLGLKK